MKPLTRKKFLRQLFFGPAVVPEMDFVPDEASRLSAANSEKLK
jgi:hypothetical protein